MVLIDTVCEGVRVLQIERDIANAMITTNQMNIKLNGDSIDNIRN